MPRNVKILLMAVVSGLFISLCLAWYIEQPPEKIRQTQPQQSESLGYFSPDGNYHETTSLPQQSPKKQP